MLYFDLCTDFKLFFLTPKDFFYPENCRIYCYKYFCFSDFAGRMIKQENFLNVVDLYII